MQIRDLDDDVYAALVRRAAEAGVSVPELLCREATRLARPAPLAEAPGRPHPAGGLQVPTGAVLMSRVVHELVEDALGELADERCQRRVWLAADGPVVSSLTECVSRLFDDSGLASALEGASPVYGRLIDEALRDLGRMLDSLDDGRAPEAVLDDPQLGRARHAAAALLVQLREARSHGEA